MKRIVGLLLVLILAGCVSSETVTLRKADGDTVTCGPYTATGRFGQRDRLALAKLRACVGDYQRQGYERVPGA